MGSGEGLSCTCVARQRRASWCVASGSSHFRLQPTLLGMRDRVCQGWGTRCPHCLAWAPVLSVWHQDRGQGCWGGGGFCRAPGLLARAINQTRGGYQRALPSRACASAARVCVCVRVRVCACVSACKWKIWNAQSHHLEIPATAPGSSSCPPSRLPAPFCLPRHVLKSRRQN